MNITPIEDDVLFSDSDRISRTLSNWFHARFIAVLGNSEKKKGRAI
ncbi:hypothetical protein D1AOALGA4SA_6824 [Olavius algarvensis Delta 1 endosymbiont]|nr:hypothetical protein D1AOALGA4SA_6824 [Olavius algarvensis Delta 1 endosymbiont]